MKSKYFSKPYNTDLDIESSMTCKLLFGSDKSTCNMR